MRWIGMAALSLAGCTATYSDVRERPPLISYVSDKSEDSVLDCLGAFALDRWKTSVVPQQHGTMLVGYGLGDTGVVATIHVFPVAEGVQVDYRQLNDVRGMGWAAVHQAVRACA